MHPKKETPSQPSRCLEEPAAAKYRAAPKRGRRRTIRGCAAATKWFCTARATRGVASAHGGPSTSRQHDHPLATEDFAEEAWPMGSLRTDHLRAALLRDRAMAYRSTDNFRAAMQEIQDHDHALLATQRRIAITILTLLRQTEKSGPWRPRSGTSRALNITLACQATHDIWTRSQPMPERSAEGPAQATVALQPRVNVITL
ncbi:hypothetical protein BJ912DRAFT_1148618 [Pholiota molesta]|nr:hypothetical protein BJ912DRAFT_1148618 [Pholiota molesta]